MSALKETIIEKLEGLPEPALRQVMDFLARLAGARGGKEPTLLSVAGALSGTALSADEIERELYGPRKSQ